MRLLHFRNFFLRATATSRDTSLKSGGSLHYQTAIYPLSSDLRWRNGQVHMHVPFPTGFPDLRKKFPDVANATPGILLFHIRFGRA